jgi:hypothetical protein
LTLENAGRRLVGREAKADPDLVKKQLKATAPIDPNMQAIRVGYLKSRPANTVLPVALYWTEESQVKLGDSSLGWCMRTLSEFHSYPIKGDHQTLFFPENIGPFADALSGELERAGKRASVEAPRKVARQPYPDATHLQTTSPP